MSNYRRSSTDGCTYFFTLVSYRRQKILCNEFIRRSLRKAIKVTQIKHPFTVDAWVLLPDHLHCIWTLPAHDKDYSTRWSVIKRRVSVACAKRYKQDHLMNDSKLKYRESTIWQRRFWEHQIRDQNDFNQHLDYIHYNPVKHGLCERPVEWRYSTLHRYIKNGVYPVDWAVQGEFYGEVFGE